MSERWKIATGDDQNNPEKPYDPQSSAYCYLPGFEVTFLFLLAGKSVAKSEPPWCLPMELSIPVAAGAFFSFLY